METKSDFQKPNHSDIMTIKALVESHPDYHNLLSDKDRESIDETLKNLICMTESESEEIKQTA